MKKIDDYFGCLVIDDRIMKAKLSAKVYQSLRKTIDEGAALDLSVANAVADAMKNWAVDKEATTKRGLLNYRTTADCMPRLLDEKNVKMLTAHKVFTEAELKSRCDIMLENYCKSVTIEANTMVDMARRQILPAVESYTSELANVAAAKRSLSDDIAYGYEKNMVSKLSIITEQMDMKISELEKAVLDLKDTAGIQEEAAAIRDKVLVKMQELRAVADEAEVITAESCWPFPTYGEILFGVR